MCSDIWYSSSSPLCSLIFWTLCSNDSNCYSQSPLRSIFRNSEKFENLAINEYFWLPVFNAVFAVFRCISNYLPKCERKDKNPNYKYKADYCRKKNQPDSLELQSAESTSHSFSYIKNTSSRLFPSSKEFYHFFIISFLLELRISLSAMKAKSLSLACWNNFSAVLDAVSMFRNATLFSVSNPFPDAYLT